jgi:hypothetical protein
VHHLYRLLLLLLLLAAAALDLASHALHLRHGIYHIDVLRMLSYERSRISSEAGHVM